MATQKGPNLIVEVEQFPYDGKVWNIEPVSERAKANIFLEQGFLAGSVRFQREWADDAFRRSLRDQVD